MKAREAFRRLIKSKRSRKKPRIKWHEWTLAPTYLETITKQEQQ